MKLRATLPVTLYVTGPSADALSPSIAFTSRHCLISASLAGDDPLELESVEASDRFFRRIRALKIEIDEQSSDQLTRRLETNDTSEILQCILKPANRILKAIRNFGSVTSVREFKPKPFESDRLLDLFDVETSADGRNWTRLREPPNDLAELLASRSTLQREYIGELKISQWATVNEAIEDELAGGPEREFLANALEHLRRGDLRVAVVESIICLEILLAQLLPQLLESRGVSKDGLTKEVTLFHRVKMLVPLLLPTEAASVDLAIVLNTISWRNKIAHEQGKLPDNLDEATIRRGIVEVVGLSHRLAFKRDGLKRAPLLAEMGQDIARRFAITVPHSEWSPAHKFVVRFEFVLVKVPPPEKLKDVAEAVVDAIRMIETRCRPESDLSIFFTRLGTELATWQGGQFHVIKRPTD